MLLEPELVPVLPEPVVLEPVLPEPVLEPVLPLAPASLLGVLEVLILPPYYQILSWLR